MRAWSGGAMVLVKLAFSAGASYIIIVGQGPLALAVGAGWVCLDIFLSSIFSLFFLPLWEAARYRRYR